MNKKIIIGVIVALIVGLVVGYMVHPSAVAQQVKGIPTPGVNGTGINTAYLGAGASKVGTGCDSEFTTCVGVATYGGLLSTTTSISMTLAPTDIQYGMISMTPIVGGITVTLPATTTSGMSTFLPNAGDNESLYWTNATTTTNTSLNIITVAAGTGVLLETASSSATAFTGANPVIPPGRGSTLDCYRKVNTDIVCMFSPFI